MTILDDDRVEADVDDVAPLASTDALTASDRSRDAGGPDVARTGTETDGFVPPPINEIIRPVLAAALATTAAGLLIAGIFDSWSARLIALVGSVAGPAWA